MFLFGKKADIDIELSNNENKKVATWDGKEYPIYYDGESVSGKVNINVRPGKKLEHQGILIELIGKVEFMYDRGASQDFLCLEKDLARHGVLIAGQVSYPFEFKNVRKPFETYRGVNVNLVYIVRVHVLQRLNNIIREKEIEVQTLSLYQDIGDGVRMEVGIEDSLHIEFEYSSVRYHLEDVIVGKIYFILVRVKIKHMDLQIIRHETAGRGPTIFSESSYLNKYELMDGSPVRGESIPVRLFLKDVTGLRPSMHEVAGGLFSVRYFLNLVLTDEDDRRYYKQQEIYLYRRGEKRQKSIAGRSQVVQSLVQQGQLRGFMVHQPQHNFQHHQPQPQQQQQQSSEYTNSNQMDQNRNDQNETHKDEEDDKPEIMDEEVEPQQQKQEEEEERDIFNNHVDEELSASPEQ